MKYLSLFTLLLVLSFNVSYAQDNPDDLGNDIGNIAGQLNNRLTGLLGNGFLGGGFGGGFGNNFGSIQMTQAERAMFRILERREAWKNYRESIQARIEAATAGTKIRLLNERARADYMQARAQYEAFRTLFLERRKLGRLEIQAALLDAELWLSDMRRKVTLLRKFQRQDTQNNIASRVYRNLEYCGQRPLRPTHLRKGKAIDGLKIVLTNQNLYGPICTSQPGHSLGLNERREALSLMALEMPVDVNPLRFLMPLLQIPYEIYRDLSFVFNSVTRRELRGYIRQMESGIQAFYREERGDFRKRKSATEQLEAGIRGFIITLDNYKITHLSDVVTNFENRIQGYEDQLDQIESQIIGLDPLLDTDELTRLEETKFTVTRSLDRNLMQLSKASFTPTNLVYYAERLKEEISGIANLTEEDCQISSSSDDRLNSLRSLFAHKLLACGFMHQPRLEDLNDLQKLASVPSMRMCPSRSSLIENVKSGEIYSINDNCFASTGRETQVFMPFYQKLCTTYHQLDSCAEANGLRTTPDEGNIFDSYKRDLEEVLRIRGELRNRPFSPDDNNGTDTASSNN